MTTTPPTSTTASGDGMSADDEETFLRQRIHDITTEYRKAISPYVDRLMWIEARKPPPPVIVEITPENEALVRKLLGAKP